MSARELKIHRLGNDVAAVSLVGDQDAYSAEQIGPTIRALLEEGLDVQIDLREATFLDSATVGVLIAAHKLADESSHRLMVLMGPKTGWAVRRMFELTQLDSLLTVSSEQ